MAKWHHMIIPVGKMSKGGDCGFQLIHFEIYNGVSKKMFHWVKSQPLLIGEQINFELLLFQREERIVCG